jgi:flagellin-like protein
MKANQAFKANDEAVSPVIGVILMVAITVVLAAVVFVLVSNLSKGNDAAPTMGITADDSANKFTINTAPNGLNYGQFNLKSDKDVRFLKNAIPASATGTALAAGVAKVVDATATPATITGGDFFGLCGTGGAQTSVTIQLIHVATSRQVYSHTFPSIATCT